MLRLVATTGGLVRRCPIRCRRSSTVIDGATTDSTPTVLLGRRVAARSEVTDRTTKKIATATRNDAAEPKVDHS